jgi:predicted N-acetyltransferase YhbS
MNPRADIDIRTVDEDGLREWTRALQTGFLRSPEVTDVGLEANRGAFRPGRSLGAYDGERCVATFRSFPQELSVGGGATVPADAISNVTVSPTHRRRGILTRMMARDLAAAKERGDVVATLIAAEYPIYGRYGFGPATSTSAWTIDVPSEAELRPALWGRWEVKQED